MFVIIQRYYVDRQYVVIDTAVLSKELFDRKVIQVLFVSTVGTLYVVWAFKYYVNHVAKDRRGDFELEGNFNYLKIITILLLTGY